MHGQNGYKVKRRAVMGCFGKLLVLKLYLNKIISTKLYIIYKNGYAIYKGQG